MYIDCRTWLVSANKAKTCNNWDSELEGILK